MPVLKPEEYNASYFDGRSQDVSHNAGYSKYERWFRTDGVSSLGEFWKDKANELKNTHGLAGKKVLEIGSAKGFIVHDLRKMGVDAFGLDVSQYAYDQADPTVQPFLTVGDARTALSSYRRNEFDVAFSLRFLECIDDADLPDLIAEINRISRKQFHVIDEFTGGKIATFYNNKSTEEWQAMAFAKGTVLGSQENRNKVLIK